jgi:hypothetical protein
MGLIMLVIGVIEMSTLDRRKVPRFFGLGNLFSKPTLSVYVGEGVTESEGAL